MRNGFNCFSDSFQLSGFFLSKLPSLDSVPPFLTHLVAGHLSSTLPPFQSSTKFFAACTQHFAASLGQLHLASPDWLPSVTAANLQVAVGTLTAHSRLPTLKMLFAS